MSNTIHVQFNGRPIDVSPGTSIRQLLDASEIRSQLVAVELNLEIVPRERHDHTIVSEGDIIEAVTLVGGG